jgi:hypothetical protein
MAWPLRSLFFNWTPAVDSGICATRIDLQLLHPYEPMNIPGLYESCAFSRTMKISQVHWLQGRICPCAPTWMASAQGFTSEALG